MNCMHCENCKQNTETYFCLAKNDIMINNDYVYNNEKSRGGWKKGDPSYETHRRKTRKVVDA